VGPNPATAPDPGYAHWGGTAGGEKKKTTSSNSLRIGSNTFLIETWNSGTLSMTRMKIVPCCAACCVRHATQCGVLTLSYI
jgi:hypothetical protein